MISRRIHDINLHEICVALLLYSICSCSFSAGSTDSSANSSQSSINKHYTTSSSSNTYSSPIEIEMSISILSSSIENVSNYSSIQTVSSSSVVIELASSSSTKNYNPIIFEIKNGEYTDNRDGRTYKTLIFTNTNHEVFAQNINFGEMIINISNSSSSSIQSKYCYNNDSINCNRYGGLYKWNQAMNKVEFCNGQSSNNGICLLNSKRNDVFIIQGICPENWHIMNAADWSEVSDSHKISDFNLRSSSQLWKSGGGNTIGFSLEPGGFRTPDGIYKEEYISAIYYLPVEMNEVNGYIVLSEEGVANYVIQGSGKTQAFSIRCMRDY